MSELRDRALEKNTWEGLEHNAPEWFRDAKFGMFFHWGPYSVPACQNEWYSRNMYCKGLPQSQHHVETYGNLSAFGYKDFYPMMTGAKFNPEEWAELVERAGAKYAGPVTEHADNFSMWDSKVNPVNAVHYGPKRDVVGECTEAFRKRGIKVISTFHHQWLWGWFMSTDNEADVYVPENEKFYGPALPLETNRYMPYRMPDEKFCQIWRDKVIEVVEKYKPDALYFDSRSNIIPDLYKQQMLAHYYSVCPHGAVTFKQTDFPNQVGVVDLERGRFSESKPFSWQTDDRLEDCVTWCYVDGVKYREPQRIIQQLCDVVAKNGTLLLNLGPKADGSFPQEAKEVLYQVGGWLKTNGEAIYGTRPFDVMGEGPTLVRDNDFNVNKIKDQLDEGVEKVDSVDVFTAGDFRFTRKGETVYAIAMDVPKGQVCIRTMKAGGVCPKISSVKLLGYDGAVKWEQKEDALYVQMPEGTFKYAVAFEIE